MSSLYLCGEKPGGFAYTDTLRVVTVEFKGADLAIVNMINLTDTIIAVEACDFLVVKSNGSNILGQVFAEKTTGGNLVYQAAKIVQPRSFIGSDLLAPFRYKGDVVKIFFSQGGRILELGKLSQAEFESLMQRLSQLNIKESNMEKAFKYLAIPDIGIYISFEEADSYRRMFDAAMTEDGVNSPKIMASPPIIPTPEAVNASFKDKVKVEVQIDKSGVVQGVKFPVQPPFGLDKRIEESIRNGWKFLPATVSGDLMATVVKITIDFGEANAPGKNKTP